MNEASLLDIWNKYGEIPFINWVNEFSEAVSKSNLGIVRTAKIIGAQSAEVLAVLKLASLEDVELNLISKHVPPKTTWLLLADGNSEEIVSCLRALEQRTPIEPPFELIEKIIKRNSDSGQRNSVLALPPEVLSHFVEKAKDYNCLTPKVGGAFKRFASMHKNGKEFSLPQAEYLRSILTQLVQNGVISRNPKENDKRMCDQVMDALGI